MFANFGILNGSLYEQAEISIVSKDPIKTGMTGIFSSTRFGQVLRS